MFNDFYNRFHALWHQITDGHDAKGDAWLFPMGISIGSLGSVTGESFMHFFGYATAVVVFLTAVFRGRTAYYDGDAAAHRARKEAAIAKEAEAWANRYNQPIDRKRLAQDFADAENADKNDQHSDKEADKDSDIGQKTTPKNP